MDENVYGIKTKCNSILSEFDKLFYCTFWQFYCFTSSFVPNTDIEAKISGSRVDHQR